MAIYLGNTPIAENVTIQQGGGVTIDDTLSDTSKNPVQNKVINAALNSKANLSDIPTSLPADGGNADTANQIKCVDIIGTADSCTYHTILDWANHYANQGCAAWAFIIAGYGFPEDIPKQVEASVKIESDETGDRRIVTWTQYGTINSSYTRTIYNKSWYSEWQRTSDGGNADTLDGKHASEFYALTTGLRKGTQLGDIFSNSLSPSHPAWNSFCAIEEDGSGEAIENAPSSTRPARYEVWTCGENINRGYQIAVSLFERHKIFIRYLQDGNWSGWYNVADDGNADTVDGLHANEIASNPNLLINPDFRINQRGISSPTAAFGADRWVGTYTVSNNTIVFSQAEQYMIQSIENIDSLIGREATATVYYDDGTADKGTATISDTAYFFTTSRTHCLVYTQNGIKGLEIWAAAPCNIVGVKLELGGIATPFTPPDPATELAKCQRYYYSTYQGVPAGTPASYANELVLNAISANRFNHTMIDFPVTMRITPTVKFFDPATGEEGYAHKSGTDEKVPVDLIIAGQDKVNFGSSGLTVGMDYYLHYTASAEL